MVPAEPDAVAVAELPASASAVDAGAGVARAPLRVASWNIQRLGQRSTTQLQVVAAVLATFDLVAIQEVMTVEVAQALDEALPLHRILLTDGPFPPEGSYREYYAFAYRADRMTAVANASVPDPDGHFMRDPFVGCFDLIAGGDLCLLTIHVVFGDRVAERKREILRLDDALRWAQELRPDQEDWIVLGDFNRPIDNGDDDSQPEDEWRELLDRRSLRSPVAPVGDEQPTTLGASGYANAYDHVFVSSELGRRVTAAGRVDIVQSECAGDFARCRRRLSDHAPVFVELTTGSAPAASSR